MDTTGLKYKLKFVDAEIKDHKLLTETAIESKRYWGYSDELINLWRSDLEVTKEFIQKNKVVKVYDEGKFIGFFGLKPDEKNNVEIEHLWLTPDNIGKGYGKLIFQYILQELKSEGFKVVKLTAEPNAKGFYEKMGGRVIGNVESKVSGRFLDVYEFDLDLSDL